MIYVDDMYLYPMGQFGRMKCSHMIADTQDELHAMAARLGLQRRWYQRNHYDVSMSLRTKALSLGATAITLRECCFMSVLQRRDPTQPLLTPEAGAAWLTTQREAHAAARTTTQETEL